MDYSLFKPTRFSFGVTSAIITSLALISGLDTVNNAKLSIIGGLLVIAIADNISDTLGIHVYKEAETTNAKEVFYTTVVNYIARFVTSFIFVLIIYFFPLNIAVVLSVIYGIFLLSLISFIIAREKKQDPIRAVMTHLLVAVIVIIVCNYLSKFIPSKI